MREVQPGRGDGGPVPIAPRRTGRHAPYLPPRTTAERFKVRGFKREGDELRI